MIKLGQTARHLRELHGVSQKDAAVLLGISQVHLCNIENNISMPSPALLGKFRDVWKVDLYMLAWCLLGDIEELPPSVRKAAKGLSAAWRGELAELQERLAAVGERNAKNPAVEPSFRSTRSVN